MHFRFKLRKTLQAVAVLLRNEPSQRTNYMRLLKLLYIADRECLKESGRSITGDGFVAMKRGPVPSQSYDLIRGRHLQSPEWSASVRKNGYNIELARDPGLAELSRFEIDILQRVSERHAGNDEWEMVEITHGFEEWRKNDPGDSSRPIPLEDILEAVGRSADEASIAQDAKDEAAFDRVFGQ